MVKIPLESSLFSTNNKMHLRPSAVVSYFPVFTVHSIAGVLVECVCARAFPNVNTKTKHSRGHPRGRKHFFFLPRSTL